MLIEINFHENNWIIRFRFTVISTNVVGSKHEAKRQDRKFTWDFYG